MNYLRSIRTGIFGSPTQTQGITPISSVHQTTRTRAQTTVEPPIKHNIIKETCNEAVEGIKSCCKSCYKNAIQAGSCIF